MLDSPSVEGLPQVEASLNYVVPTAEKPVNYTFEPPPGIPVQGGTYEARVLPIHNARSIAPSLSLDREGFAFVSHCTAVQNFDDRDEVERVYYPEATEIVRKATGATNVMVFDHMIRKDGQVGVKQPVKSVHNDFTTKSVYVRARKELVSRNWDNPDELLQQRFAVVNVWRPIVEPVQALPLAVCDAQSIAATDWVPTDIVYRDRVGETYAVAYNPMHRWFYFPQMRRDEAILIKCFDSATDGRARFAAHSAFDDPTTQPDAPSRQSIELRTLVFYP
ncbi:MAG TPA: CmcJ/NvfI family oxidoreductase [Trichocoleus sp.]|jgi:hypothetical protein